MKTRLSLFVGSILTGILFSLTPAPLHAEGPIQSQAIPSLSGCSIFPADNIWNTPVDTLPVDPNSAAYIANIGPDQMLHPDFGEGLWLGAPIGIPYNVVPFTQTEVAITDFLYDDESDPGPYPVPPDALIEGGPSSSGDRHVLVMRQGDCKLFEIFNAFPNMDMNNTWRGDSGAIFDLTSNALRSDTWTSADAAGLPILPGLVRYDEASSGEINHALRFTVSQTRRDYVWPPRHFASSSTDPNRPPMGQRFRLKASFVIDSSLSTEGQAILQALKKYGMILADNGSNWYISGEPSEMWDNDALHEAFDTVKGADLEAVDTSSLLVDEDSGQAQILGATPGTQGVDPGGVTTYVVSLLDTDSIDTPLTLVTSSPSPSLTLKLSAASISPNGQVTLTVTDTHPSGPITPGILYILPISATGSGVTQTTTVNLLVGGKQIYLPVIVK